MQNQQLWSQLARKVKARFVDVDDRGELLPVVATERDGNLEYLVIAPLLDKHLALIAARALWHGFHPDALVLILDAHVKVEQMPSDGAIPDSLKNYRAGEMQRQCDEEGACDAGLITDVLLIHRIDRQGKTSALTLPYAYHGKGGTPFRWLDDPVLMGGFNEASDEMVLGGAIPTALTDMVAETPEAGTLALMLLQMMDYHITKPSLADLMAEVA